MDNITSGSRRVHGILTQRTIDYSVCNAKYLIIHERHLEEWSISDHLPVETIIYWENKQVHKDINLYFDRPKLRDNKIKKKILNYKFTQELSATPQDTVDKFYNELNKLLEDTKILNKKVETDHRPNKKIRDLIIKRKRTIEEENRIKITKEIKLKGKEIRKEQYNKFISKGCEVMLNLNSKESWKWIKQVSGMNKIAGLNYPIKDKETGTIEHSNEKKAFIFMKHLRKLAEKRIPLLELQTLWRNTCYNAKLKDTTS